MFDYSIKTKNKKGFIQHHKTGAGFTLVELLVVIAIIGILSTVAVVNLNAAREKAKLTVAQSSLSNIMPVIIDCINNEIPLNSNSGNCEPWNTAVSTGVLICAGSTATWPSLPSGFGDMYCFNWSGALAYGAQYQPPGGPTVSCSMSGGCTLP